MFHKLMHHPFMDRLRQPCYADKAKLLLRVAAGSVFIRHGAMKLFGGLAMTAGFFSKIGIPAPGLMAPCIGALECFGGMLLVIGLGTRLLGLLFAADMLTAIGAAFGWNFNKAELETMLLATSVSLLLSDAGAYSLDAWLMKRSKKEHEASLPTMKP